LPGIDSEVSIEYSNGIFQGQVSAAYGKGMLSGSLEFGVTNRALGEDGQPTDVAGEELRPFGGGQLTIKFTPWLQGTAGVRITPIGELEVKGEIGLPSNFVIFDRKEINKSILNIAVQIPIFPGIVAEIGGGLKAQAGIGPGVIDQLKLGVTYNPSREQDTHIVGDAHLSIPADAGLRLSVKAGIGLGITGASATGGLEIGGKLGIVGSAQAGVHVDWTPAKGLVLDAFGEIKAEPKFIFDVSGYVDVRVLGFSIYEETWKLTEFEFGSGLTFGVRFPIHYVEGEPFSISLDDVEFIVPDLDPGDILDSLIAKITD
jgi:hypothetical protein